MYCKKLLRIFFLNFIRLVFYIIVKMCSKVEESDSQDVPFAFKAFRYEQIRPHRQSPYPRSGHRIGADSSGFYSFGGYNPLIRNDDSDVNVYDDFYVDSYPLFQELWKFNYASKKWFKYPNSESLPKELASNALILHKNILMVYGGTGSPFGFRCSNQLYVCKVGEEASNMIEVNASGQKPPALYGQAIIYHNEYLYTVGGTTGLSYTCDIYRLNLKTLQWEAVYLCYGQGDYEPVGRYRHEVGFDGRVIYVLGGGTAEDAYDFLDVPCFDIEKNYWYKQRTIQDHEKGIPKPRRCHGAVQVETESGVQVFITGGHDGENIFRDLWRLNLKTYEWTCFSTCQLPRPTYFHATAISPEGRLYVFGGIYSIDEGAEVVRTNNIFSTWLCIPKLSEICWEAVLHYYPHVVNCSKDKLINVGLPRHFVQRIDCKWD